MSVTIVIIGSLLRSGSRARSPPGDHATGDARPRVSRGITRVVVRVLVHDETGAVAVEETVRSVSQRDVAQNDLDRRRLSIGHLDIRHVARMGALWVVASVLWPRRIEVHAGRFERRLAAPHRVHVEGVLTRWEIGEPR